MAQLSTQQSSYEVTSTQKALFGFDNLLGYRYGTLMWLTFWIPSFVVLLADNTTGPSRDYLWLVQLFSTLTYAFYTHHHGLGTPASTPGVQGITAELFARWLCIAYYGFSQITGNHPIGVMNWIQFVLMAVFTASKIPAVFYTLVYREEYKKYEENMSEHII